MSSVGDEPSDEGLARERTALSWNRSGLAVVVCIAVLLRHLWPITGVAEDVAVALIAVAAAVWSVALLYFSRATDDGGGEVGSRVFPIMTVGTLLLAAVGFVLAFVAVP